MADVPMLRRRIMVVVLLGLIVVAILVDRVTQLEAQVGSDNSPWRQ